MRRLIGLAVAMGLAAGAQAAEPSHTRALAAGYKAAFLCSGLFNAGQTERQVTADDLTGIYPDYQAIVGTLPARIDRAEKGHPIDREALFRKSIEQRGLRAQLRTGNLLTGQKFLAMDYFKNAPPLKPGLPVMLKDGTRILPAIPGTLDELQETLSSIAKKIEKIPFDQLANELRGTLKQMQVTMKNADGLFSRVNEEVAPEVVQTLAEVKRTMKTANDALAADAPLQQDLRGTLIELNRAAASLRLLSDYLQRHPESLLRGKAPDPTFNNVPATPGPQPPAPSGGAR